jgi:hypothetical protein
MQKPDRAIYLTFAGVRLTLCEWAKRTGIPRTTLALRVQMMWNAEQILTTPANEKRPVGDRRRNIHARA